MNWLSAMKDTYLDRGFAICQPVHQPSRLECAKDAIERIQSAVGDLPPSLGRRLVLERSLPAKTRGYSSNPRCDEIFIIGDPPAFDPTFAELAVEPELVALVQKLLGTADIVYHFSNVTMKRSRVGSAIAWHRDLQNQYICPKGGAFLRIMICLDGMTSENGATRFVAGSHLVGDVEARGADAGVAAAQARSEIVHALCAPGAIIAIHPKSIHGGPPNESGQHRRNVIIQWGRADDPIDIASARDETLVGYGVAEIRDWLERHRIPGEHLS